MPEDADDDGQPHGGLGGRHGHDEEHHDVATGTVELGQSHEAQVDGVEHQLDAHEENDGIPPKQYAGHAEAEEDGRESEGRAEQHQTFRLARTTAPTMATSSRIEVISKGIR